MKMVFGFLLCVVLPLFVLRDAPPPSFPLPFPGAEIYCFVGTLLLLVRGHVRTACMRRGGQKREGGARNSIIFHFISVCRSGFGHGPALPYFSSGFNCRYRL